MLRSFLRECRCPNQILYFYESYAYLKTLDVTMGLSKNVFNWVISIRFYALFKPSLLLYLYYIYTIKLTIRIRIYLLWIFKHIYLSTTNLDHPSQILVSTQNSVIRMFITCFFAPWFFCTDSIIDKLFDLSWKINQDIIKYN